jgi:hypothetical protein
MPPRPEQRQPAVFQPRPETIRDLIHKLAKDTANVRWSQHALERMDQRGIRDKVALDVLRAGQVKGGVHPGKKPGEWKVKMVMQVKGRREMGVVVLTVHNARLYVSTVEWEDTK